MEKKRKVTGVIGKDESSYVDAMLKEMAEAAEEDARLNRENKPAVRKLFLIDKVYERLLVKSLHEELLDKGVLKILRQWLEPLPDRSLPSYDVKKAVLALLEQFKPEAEHLVESGVGKIVLFYSKNPREKKEIQTLARQLVIKWIALATHPGS